MCGKTSKGRLGKCEENVNEDELSPEDLEDQEEMGSDRAKTEGKKDNLQNNEEEEKKTRKKSEKKKIIEEAKQIEKKKPEEAAKINYLTRPVCFKDLKSVMYVSCGKKHTMIITSDDAIIGWGRNKEGQLGILGRQYIERPTPIIAMEGIPVIMAACGDTHSLIMTTAGDVYACGQDDSGKLGFTQMIEGLHNTKLKCEVLPRKVNVNIIYY